MEIALQRQVYLRDTVTDDIRFEVLDAGAREEILRHLLRLSDDDRHLRFGGTVTAEGIARYTGSLDLARDRTIAARDREGRIAGIAQIMPITSDGVATAEVAFSIDPARRGVGLGKRLVGEAIILADRLGVRRLLAQVCPGNAPMLSILRRVGMNFAREDGEMVGTLFLHAR